MGLKVFLSYAHDSNAELVLRIRRDLEADGHIPWIDTSEIKSGDDWRRTILDGLSDTHCTLAFLSAHAVREGGVCLDEIALAMGTRFGNLATILVEPEDEVRAPVSVSHIQWLDMSGWATQDEAWYQDKLQAIKNLLDDPETHRFRGEIEALERRLHPVTQAADIAPLIDGFVGREWVVAAVEAWRRTALQRRIFWLTGGPGAGKSAFSAWLSHFQRANVVGLNLCRWNDEDRSDPRRVLRTLAFLLATRLPDYRRRLLDRFRLHDPKGEELDRKGAVAMFHWLLAEPLNHLIDGGRRRDRCVLLIDALDETLRDGVSELANLLAELTPKLPAWMAVLLTSRPDFPIAASLSHVAPFRLDADNSAANAADLRVYARGWLASPDRPAAEADALIARVVAAADGNFMYLRKLREAVAEFGLDLNAPGALPQGLSGLYRLWSRRQFPDTAVYRAEIAPLLEVLVAASRPVPVDLLRGMFRWDVPTEARLLQGLGSLFEERPDGVTPFHASVRDWLTDRGQSGAAFVVDAARGSTRLATALWERFLASSAGSLPDAFALAELPAQLAHQDAACLWTLLNGPGFESMAERMKGVADTLQARVSWRAVLAWLGALDRIAEIQGEAGLPWRHYTLQRRANALATLGQMNEALAAHDAAVAAAGRAAAAGPDDTPRRNDLAAAFMNRGVAKEDAPGHGSAAAIADYDRAIELRQALRDALGDDWPVPWRNNLAAAFMNRGNAKQDAPGHGPAAAIADYDRAIELGQALRDALGDDWPVPCRNDLAAAFMNRGVAKRSAPGHGPAAAIADYDRAIELRLALRDALGDDWPVPWRNDLANAFMNRGNAKQSAPGHGPAAAIADYNRAIELMQALRDALGDDWPVPWRNDLAAAFMNRGNAKQDAPGHGPAAAIADYDRAIELRQALRDALGDDWPIPWRNDLAAAFMNRGVAKQDAPGYGPAAAIADYDRAIELRLALRDALGDDWPVPWRNDLANAFMNRGNAKQSAPGHGPAAAIADYDRAIELMQALRDAMGDDWPVPWRNDLAAAFINRGVAKQDAPGHGPAAAIADYDRAIELMQALRAALGDDWPVPWRNDLAAAFINRGNAKQSAPGHGPAAASADYDRAIELMQALRDALGDDWPVPWRNDLAGAFMNRGVAKQDAPGHGPAAAIADYDRAIELMQALRDALGDDWPIPWRNDLAAAFMNRGVAKQDAPGYGPAAAIADYDRAIALREALERDLGSQMPPVWLGHLETARQLRAEAQDTDRASEP